MTQGLVDWLARLTSVLATGAAGAVLGWWFLTSMRTQSWTTIAGVLIPLSIVWVLMGVGTVASMVPGIEAVEVYGVKDAPLAAVIVGASVLGSLLYFICYRVTRFTLSVLPSIQGVKTQSIGAAVTLMGLIPIDWYARISSIRSGTYIKWVAPIFEEAHATAVTDPLMVLMTTTGYVIVGLLVYGSFRGTRGVRLLSRALLLVQALLIMGRGRRRDIFFLLLIIVVAYGVFNARELVTAGRIVVLGALGVAFIVLLAAVPQARKEIRSQAASLSGDRGDIVGTFVFEILPGYVIDPSSYRRLGENLGGRLAAYPSFATAVAGSQLSGKNSPIGVRRFLINGSAVVPEAVYPNKPRYEPNITLWQHYSGVVPSYGFDVHATPAMGGLAYLGLVGFALAFIVGGVLAGGLMELLWKIRPMGGFVALAATPVILPLGKDIAGYMIGFRNAGMIVLLLYSVVVLTAVVRRGSS